MEFTELKKHMTLAAAAISLALPDGYEVAIMVIDTKQEEVLGCVSSVPTPVVQAAARKWADSPDHETQDVAVTVGVVLDGDDKPQGEVH